MRTLLICLSTFLISTSLLASPGDTTLVKAFSFSDPSPEGWSSPYQSIVSFPDDGKSYRQILMIQHLKCDVRTKHDTFHCGEWDYHTQYSLLMPKGDTTEVFNLISFITPYGIRLKMGGENGWKWVYDVTDYAPLLKGDVEIKAGNNQELLDLTFLFIEGTPFRPCLKVENIYPYANYQYGLLADDSLCKEQEILLDSAASGFAIKSAISGHGHSGPRNCCEWDSKTHSLYINGENPFRWNVWKDCGFNAIYPQGGTWPFDRAGWCPGTAVDEHWFELTPKVKPGDTVKIDYGIEHYSGNGEKKGEFRMSHQLFSYASFTHEVNARITDIISPSTADKHSRVNPSCNLVSFEIQNIGSTDLTQARIMYTISESGPGVSVTDNGTYDWTGSLKPMEKALISFSIDNLNQYAGQEFLVFIMTANGKDHGQLFDGRNSSIIPEANVLASNLIIELHTNDVDRARENRILITDENGKAILYGGAFLDDSTYTMPLSLEEGCYTLRLTDEMEDGISRHWWYRSSDPEKVGINGRLSIMDENGEVLESFHPDFGQEILYRFVIGNR